MDDPKPRKDYHEGEEAARRFENLVKRALAVPREEYEKRHKSWEKTKKSHRTKKAR